MCQKYFSVGLSSQNFIANEIIPRMNENDMLIHTSLSHLPEDQNLIDINVLESYGKNVCFGQHSINHEVVFTAIGAGAKKIFTYIGDKRLQLPDLHHAIDLCEAENFFNQCLSCFSAMKINSSENKVSKIDFIG